MHISFWDLLPGKEANGEVFHHAHLDRAPQPLQFTKMSGIMVLALTTVPRGGKLGVALPQPPSLNTRVPGLILPSSALIPR